MLLSLGRYVFFGMVAALAVAAGGVVAPAGPAAAQPQPTMVISPSSGPCDATVEVRGSGFPEFAPGQATNPFVYLIQPGTTDVSMEFLARVYPYQDGAFSQRLELREDGCEAVALDRQAEQPAGYLTIAAAAPGGVAVHPGDHIPNIIAVAHYTYTTPPPPVIVISPSSGPCDATVEVTGQDFPPNAPVEVGVGGAEGDLIVGHLGSVVTDGQGHLSLRALLGFLGCAMASVTKDQSRGDQLWVVGYVLEPGPSGRPTARTLARAPYTFTTTESTLPIAVLTLSPSTGPCDATVEATGTLFEPGSDVTLLLARPAGEGSMGTLGQVRADANGGFVATLTLGSLGCQAAAALRLPLGEPNEFHVCGAAYQASICAEYASTTTAVTSEGTPIALPQTGQGGTSPGMDIRPMAVVAGLLGVALLAGGFLAGRRRLQ